MMAALNHLCRQHRLRPLAIIIVSSVWLFPFAVQAASIAIVSHADLHLKKNDRLALRAIFLKKTTRSADNKPLVPINLPTTHPVRSVFSKLILGESPNASARYWNKQYFLGVSPPFVLNSQEAILRFVSETPGGLGYVLDCRADDRVNIIAHIQVPTNLADSLERYCQ